MSQHGHKTDPIENLCMEIRVAIGPRWNDQPCRCAELRVAYGLGVAAERERVGRAIDVLVESQPTPALLAIIADLSRAFEGGGSSA